VPSRRLGRSLGVNNVPFKTCTYSCIYCQLGRTTRLTLRREGFHDPMELAREVEEALASGVEVDYVTVVPDGEPTLDSGLGKLVELLKSMGARVAVLTNASLLWREDVRQDLEPSDLVSLKLDSVVESSWVTVNRPHPELSLEEVLAGVQEFAESFKGRLLVESMLIDGVNDSLEELRSLAEFIPGLRPFKAYVAVPTRPPAEPWVRPSGGEALVTAYELVKSKLGEGRVELLASPEGLEVGVVGDPVDAVARTCSVHPLRLEQALNMLAGRVEEPEGALRGLIDAGVVEAVNYRGEVFLVRRPRT